MTRVWNGPWADERQTGEPIIDCVVASFLNGENVESHGAQPHSDDEVNALRRMSGDTTGGESLFAGDLAVQRRYHRRPHAHLTTRAEISAALTAGHYVVIIGMIGALPPNRRTQSRSVMHAVLFGPDVIIDPMDTSAAGHPSARSISLAAQLVFASSGGYEAYEIVPNRYYTPRTAKVTRARGRYYPYTRHADGSWSRPKLRRMTLGFSAVTSIATPYPNVLGKTRRMVEVKVGFLNGKWLDLAQMTSYTED